MKEDVGTSKPKKACEQGRETNIGPKIKQSTYTAIKQNTKSCTN